MKGSAWTANEEKTARNEFTGGLSNYPPYPMAVPAARPVGAASRMDLPIAFHNATIVRVVYVISFEDRQDQPP